MRYQRWLARLRILCLLLLVPGLGAQTPGQLRWTFSTAGRIYSTPAIGSNQTIYVGSDDGHLYALSPQGTSIWSFAAGDAIRSSPAIADDGTIYFGSWDHRVYAINADGTLKWSFLTRGVVDSSPAIAADGTIVVGSADSQIYALNPDGSQRWAYDTRRAVVTSPVIDADGTIVVGSNDGNVYALAADGTLRWRYPLGNNVASSAAVNSDGSIYFGSVQHRLFAVDHFGKRVFTLLARRYRDFDWSPFGFDNGFNPANSVVYAPTIAPDGTISFGVAATAEGSLVGLLYAVSPVGRVKWIVNTHGIISGSTAIAADGTIYLGTTANQLRAVSSTGTLLWTLNLGGDATTSPTIGADGTVYIGCRDFKLYAVQGTSPPPATVWPAYRGNALHQARQSGSYPTISVTSPAPDAILNRTNPVTVLATAADADGTVRSVEFFVDGRSVGLAESAPYSALWSRLAPGKRTLTAVARDDQGRATLSAPVNVLVDAIRPSVHILSAGAPRALPGTNHAQADFAGSARDNGGVAQVLARVGSGAFQPAMGTTNWSATVDLVAGRNLVEIKAVDFAGNENSARYWVRYAPATATPLRARANLINPASPAAGVESAAVPFATIAGRYTAAIVGSDGPNQTRLGNVQCIVTALGKVVGLVRLNGTRFAIPWPRQLTAAGAVEMPLVASSGAGRTNPPVMTLRLQFAMQAGGAAMQGVLTDEYEEPAGSETPVHSPTWSATVSGGREPLSAAAPANFPAASAVGSGAAIGIAPGAELDFFRAVGQPGNVRLKSVPAR